jgi:hypothetical protein
LDGILDVGSSSCRESTALFVKPFVEGLASRGAVPCDDANYLLAMVADPLEDVTESPRYRLTRLDFLLEELEELIFRDMTQLPVRVGSALQRVGVSDPYLWSIPDLLDRIFELQEPILALLRQRSISRRV